ncbi:MAG: carboxypeptidase-like regulatory domain-containing protein, partial [Bacteroidales bacterium]|nr:carboxypeptidase-like regulatory domain-containing protein [Bacteroidales bacterium]
INIENLTLTEALDECLRNKDLQYKIVDDVIIIEPKVVDNDENNEQKTLFQTIRGQVIDLNTESPLTGANVVLTGHNPVKGTVTDINGYFEIKNVPVGRQNIEVSYMGYNSAEIKNLYVISGKELILQVKLEEKVFVGEEIVFKAYRKDKPLNEMAQVSARSFTVEETERYAGAIGDPSRMAASFAGVLTLGTQINDIVIRGNSTMGMLWRMEGLKIPNPNHFGDPWTTGGTSSMINNNVLSNSDFYTGAFPAEFGDATSGVFDLNLRKGNSEKKEYVAQIGFGGLEFGAEGPFIKEKRASYMANYRYSTMGVFDLLGLDIGIFTVPTYQDLSFNINIPTKTGKFSVFGLGGIDGLHSEDIDESKNLIDIIALDAYMGFTGFNYMHFLNENTSLSTSIGISKSQNKTLIDKRINNEIDDFYLDKMNESTFEFLTELNRRINSRNYMKFGFNYFNSNGDFNDSLYITEYKIFVHNKNMKGSVPLVQGYGQWKHRFNDQLSFVSGIHYQYSKLGDDHAIEPRLSITWDFLPKQSISLGLGTHSKLQPKFIYHYEFLKDTANKVYEKPNINLKMTRSKHVVLGYNYLFNSNHRLKIETYYQYLSNVPVEKDSSYKSLINFGTSFSDFEYKGLNNSGIGYNYGTEFTLEKFLSKGYYYLFTLSLFNSKYKGSNGKLRNTRFNANIICNLLGGYEWTIKNNNTIGWDGRVICAGGERKIPLDYEASAEFKEARFIEDNAYDERFKNYFRLDIKFFYKINKKTSHMIAIDILNATNRQNHFLALYDEEINDYKEESMLGIIPAFLWRWNF